ncbi:hypothetical protein GCM10010532_079730 [Dactylosporangium siamense]
MVVLPETCFGGGSARAVDGSASPPAMTIAAAVTSLEICDMPVMPDCTGQPRGRIAFVRYAAYLLPVAAAIG